jgi:hypothetical protein
MSSSPAAAAHGSRFTPTRLLLAALASIVVAGLLTAIYPYLITLDAPNPVLTATGALGTAAGVMTLVLVVAAIVRRLARSRNSRSPMSR